MNDLMRHRGEILRALANRKFDTTSDGGILLRAGINAIPMGVFDIEHRREGDLIGRDIGSNVIPTEGLNHILDVLLHQAAQVGTWYMALFEGNVTPLAGWTGVNFAGNATETTAYDETKRVPYVEGAAVGGVTDNAASRAIFTMNATKTIYGGALLSVDGKAAITGTLLAAARFGSPRAVEATDELAVKYTLTLTPAP